MTEQSSNVPVNRYAMQNGSLLRLPSSAALSSSRPLSVPVSMLRKPRPLVLSSPPARPRVVGVAALSQLSGVRPRIFLVPQGQLPSTAATSGVSPSIRPPAGRLKVISKPSLVVNSMARPPVPRAETLAASPQLPLARKLTARKRVLPSHMTPATPADNGAVPTVRPPGLKLKHSSQRAEPLHRRRPDPEPVKKPQLSWDLDLLAGDGPSPRAVDHRFDDDSDRFSSSCSEEEVVRTPAPQSSKAAALADGRLKRPTFSPLRCSPDLSDSPESSAQTDGLRHIHDDWALIKRSLHAVQSDDSPRNTKTKSVAFTKPSVGKTSAVKSDVSKKQSSSATKKKRGRPRKHGDEKQSMSDYWKHKVMSPERSDAPKLSAETSQHVDDVINSVIAASSAPQSPQKSSVFRSPSKTDRSQTEAPFPAAPDSSECVTASRRSVEESSGSKAESVGPKTGSSGSKSELESKTVLTSDQCDVTRASVPAVPISAVFGDICEQVVRMFSKQVDETLVPRGQDSFRVPGPVISLKSSLSASHVFVMSDELYRLGATDDPYQYDPTSADCHIDPSIDPELESEKEVPVCVTTTELHSLFSSQKSAGDSLRDASLARLCSVQIEERPGVLVFLDQSPKRPLTSTSTPLLFESAPGATLSENHGAPGATMSGIRGMPDTTLSGHPGGVADTALFGMYGISDTTLSGNRCGVPDATLSGNRGGIPDSTLSGSQSGAVHVNGDVKWQCNRCSSVFHSLSHQLLHQLRFHMLQHDRVVCVGCPLVARRLPPDQLSQQLLDLLTHFLRHVDPVSGSLLGATDPVIRHLSVDGSAMQLACGCCPRQFSSGSAFGEHELGCSRLQHVCGTCAARFRDAELLAAHVLEHRRCSDGRFACDICSCSFSRVEQLAAHRRFHFKQKKVACAQCDRRFVSAAMLNMHIKWKHSDGPCRFCQRHFNSATARKVHEEHSHLKHLPLMCGQCQLRVATPSQLRVHRRLHDKLSPHACTQCSASFVSRGLLKKHRVAEHQEQEIKEEAAPTDSDGGRLRTLFNIYRTWFEGATGAMTLSDLDTESDEEEHRSRSATEATQQMFQHKDKQTKSVWSCPVCKLYFTKLWGVRAHITLKHPGAGVEPVLHDASHSGASSKKAFLRELKRKVRFDKKQDRLAIKMQERLARFGAGGPRRGRPLKNPLFAARPRKPPLPPPADGIPRKRGRPRKLPLAPREAASPAKPRPEPEAGDSVQQENGEELRRWRCDICSSVIDSYDELVTHTYAQHPDLSLPRFSVLVERGPPPPPLPGHSSTAPPLPSPAVKPPHVRAPERGRGSRRPRGRVVSRRSSAPTAASTADLYRRQYNTLSGSRRRSLAPRAPEPPVVQEPQRLYCVCQVPYMEGVEMIGCDGPRCRNEWFHFHCVNIVSAPKGNWFCPDCAK